MRRVCRPPRHRRLALAASCMTHQHVIGLVQHQQVIQHFFGEALTIATPVELTTRSCKYSAQAWEGHSTASFWAM